jgi:hypothetical protein
MTQRELEKQRLFSIVAYCEEASPIQVRVNYVKDFGDIPLEQVRKLLVEMADDGTLEKVKTGIYRRPI